jgi:hypothetical protein
MRLNLAVIALATAAFIAIGSVASPLPAAASSASFCAGNRFFCRDLDPFSDRNNTNFDLGVDVSNVPLTRAGLGQFLATLSPEGQTIMFRTCQNYLGNPSQVQSPRTIEFCRALLGR